jgi:hypothetical protein
MVNLYYDLMHTRLPPPPLSIEFLGDNEIGRFDYPREYKMEKRGNMRRNPILIAVLLRHAIAPNDPSVRIWPWIYGSAIMCLATKAQGRHYEALQKKQLPEGGMILNIQKTKVIFLLQNSPSIYCSSSSRTLYFLYCYSSPILVILDSLSSFYNNYSVANNNVRIWHGVMGRPACASQPRPKEDTMEHYKSNNN